MWETVVRAAEADSGASLLAAARRGRDRVLPDLAVRRPGRPARGPPRGVAAPPALLGHRRDHAAGAGAGHGGADRCAVSSTSRWSSGPRRSTPSAGTASGASGTRTRSRPGRRPAVPVGGAVPPGRGRARGLPGLADVRALRQRPARRPRHRARRVPARAGGAVAPLHRGGGANPEAWFPVERSAAEIIDPTPANRMVASPYTKYMVSIMDVDMAAAVVPRVGGDRRRARRRGRPARVPRGAGSTRPIRSTWPSIPTSRSSPAMRGRDARRALGQAGVGVDDCAHLDLYSCFGSSVNFMRDALGIGPDDPRPLTVTGGLPYHGGAGSDYLTHAIAQMTRVLRADPGAFGLVTGVGHAHDQARRRGVLDDPGTGRRSRSPPPAPATRSRSSTGSKARRRSVAATVVYGAAESPSGVSRCATSGTDGGSVLRPDRGRRSCSPTPRAGEWTGRSVTLSPHPAREGVNLVVA